MHTMTFKWVPVIVATPTPYSKVSVKDKTGQTAKAIWTGLSWHVISGSVGYIVAWLS